MLVHHSSQAYNEAAAAARKVALPKLEALIENGRSRAVAVIDQVQNQVPQDFIQPAKGMMFRAAEGVLKMDVSESPVPLLLHRHALGQAASRADIPLTYVDTLRESGQLELLAHNFNQRFKRDGEDKTRYLLRAVGAGADRTLEVRGFLSDKYRRLDARPLLTQFLKSCEEIGALPFEGFALDTKVSVRAVLPKIFEPIKNEVMVFGAAYENSDFGNGAVSMRFFVTRLWCTNTAITDEAIREIHLGARLQQNLSYSRKTYELDSQTVASAMHDHIGRIFAPDTVDTYMSAIKAAHEDKLDPKAAKERLKKMLTKHETEQVIEAFNSPDVEMMPAGNTRWRLSNAVSHIANRTENEERRIELGKVAGSFLNAKLVADAI